MAPTNQKTEKKTFARKEGNWNKSKNVSAGVKKKRKWVPEHKKFFEGSVKEGQGFAFKRKQMVQYEYNKLKRKQGKTKTIESLYKEEYPEHLKHLYQAEAEKLKKEAWENRVKRSKKRMGVKEEEEEEEKRDEVAEDAPPPTKAAALPPKATAPPPEAAAGPESEVSSGPEHAATPDAATQKESLPISNRMRKKLQKKTSFQKTKEEYEQVKEKRRKKKEEFLKNKKQREEAIERYKQKKMETFQMLSKKTKRGQPNLNLQMEYLLQKIQKTQP